LKVGRRRDLDEADALVLQKIFFDKSARCSKVAPAAFLLDEKMRCDQLINPTRSKAFYGINHDHLHREAIR
jgi:hypothetical protein